MNRFPAFLGIFCVILSAAGADWPNWRGPTQNGVAPAGQYPTKWSATENLAWKISLPGRGASTPIVWDRRIFLTYDKDGNNALACVNWNGQLRWEVLLGLAQRGRNAKATGSNPSVATDGKALFAYFKSGDLACVDFNGKVIWNKNLPQQYGEVDLWLDPDSKTWPLWWDLGTSPVLTKSCVVIAVIQSGPSYLVAFDKQTGDEIWKQDRNLGAPVEAAQSYTTPVVVTDSAGKETILTLGADHITAHDGATGAELWRVGGLNPRQEIFYRSIASPVLSDEILIAPYGRAATITAVKLGGSGDVTKTHIAWFKDDLGTDVPTPAASQGRVYVCTDRGDVACLDSKTGREIWRQQLERHRSVYSSSPVLAGGHIYVTREDGKTFVLREGDKFQLEGTNELPAQSLVATPVFVDGRILIRTADFLYCIGK